MQSLYTLLDFICVISINTIKITKVSKDVVMVVPKVKRRDCNNPRVHRIIGLLPYMHDLCMQQMIYKTHGKTRSM